MKVVKALDAVTIREFVKNHLEPGCTVQTDGLNIYTGLESLVKEHQSFVIRRGAEPLTWSRVFIFWLDDDGFPRPTPKLPVDGKIVKMPFRYDRKETFRSNQFLNTVIGVLQHGPGPDEIGILLWKRVAP